MKRILFVCIGNAFRSQIAEAWAFSLGDPARVEVRSGGTHPSAEIHRAVPQLMKEAGAEMHAAQPKPIDLDYAEKADAVVSLCGPLEDACPAHIVAKTIDWAVPDPSWGTNDEMRATRDLIGTRVKKLLRELGVLKTSGAAS